MREIEIRSAVVAAVRLQHPDPFDTRIVEEFSVCLGEARVDVAAINGCIAGYEIKSARDNLGRLPRQATLFSQVTDHMTVVCAPKHLPGVRAIVPSWWGLIVADEGRLQAVRDTRLNPALDLGAMLRLLWRGELLVAARSAGIRGAGHATRAQLAGRLATEMPEEGVKELVRDALRNRDGWRARQ